MAPLCVLQTLSAPLGERVATTQHKLGSVYKPKTEKAVASQKLATALPFLAERTGLEPATPGVTGRYSNQLNYHSW